MVDSPFNEDPKNIIFSREGWPEILGNWAATGTSIVLQIGGGQFRKGISAPTPWYQNPCDASIFLHARPNFREEMKKLNFQAKI